MSLPQLLVDNLQDYKSGLDLLMFGILAAYSNNLH